MKLKDILLQPKEVQKITGELAISSAFIKRCDGNGEFIDSKKVVDLMAHERDKAQCLKLLDVLKKKMHLHKERDMGGAGSGLPNNYYTISVYELRELEKILKDG